MPRKMETMVTISKADYLKKYLSGAGDDEKKKRKKKKEKDQKTKQTGMKIVEDEAFITVRTEARSDSDDEEEMEMIEELKRKARKGPRFKKTFLSAGDDEVIEVKQEPLSDEEGPISFQIKQKESSDPKVKQEVDSDVSPRRKKENHTSEKSHRKRHDSDDNSPPRRRTRHDSDDNSPPRRRVRHDSDDNSPPRRRVRHDSDDKSPPRRRVRHDSDDKSPPRRRARHDSDASPPRKKHGRSPVRRPRHDSDDASPQRRRKDRDTDRSPPRRKRHDSDNSPPRRRGDAVKDDSPRRKKKRYDSDESPPRRSAADIKKSPASSPPRRRIASPEVGKQRKTLDGKVAGLQSAKDLKAETEKLKRKEDALFDFMDPDLSGKNAATVHREKQVGRRKNNTEDQDKKEREQKKQEELQEKYSSWNKGVHQLEERKAKLEELARVVQEPLTRTADDVAMNAHLKHQLYEEDPLHKLIAKNRRHKAIDRGESVYPTYDKPFPPNRFGIRPGYRWDGVDRSNQFEAKLYISKNQKQSDNTSYYQNLGLYE